MVGSMLKICLDIAHLLLTLYWKFLRATGDGAWLSANQPQSLQRIHAKSSGGIELGSTGPK